MGRKKFVIDEPSILKFVQATPPAMNFFCLELGHWNFTRTLGTGTLYSVSTAEVQVE